MRRKNAQPKAGQSAVFRWEKTKKPKITFAAQACQEEWHGDPITPIIVVTYVGKVRTCTCTDPSDGTRTTHPIVQGMVVERVQGRPLRNISPDMDIVCEHLNSIPGKVTISFRVLDDSPLPRIVELAAAAPAVRGLRKMRKSKSMEKEINLAAARARRLNLCKKEQRTRRASVGDHASAASLSAAAGLPKSNSDPDLPTMTKSNSDPDIAAFAAAAASSDEDSQLDTMDQELLEAFPFDDDDEGGLAPDGPSTWLPARRPALRRQLEHDTTWEGSVVLSFEANSGGPLGLFFATAAGAIIVSKIGPDSVASKNGGAEEGMILNALNGKPVADLSYNNVMQMLGQSWKKNGRVVLTLMPPTQFGGARKPVSIPLPGMTRIRSLSAIEEVQDAVECSPLQAPVPGPASSMPALSLVVKESLSLELEVSEETAVLKDALRELGAERFLESFLELGVTDAADLADTVEADLLQMGMDGVHRKKFLAAVRPVARHGDFLSPLVRPDLVATLSAVSGTSPGRPDWGVAAPLSLVPPPVSSCSASTGHESGSDDVDGCSSAGSGSGEGRSSMRKSGSVSSMVSDVFLLDEPIVRAPPDPVPCGEAPHQQQAPSMEYSDSFVADKANVYISPFLTAKQKEEAIARAQNRYKQEQLNIIRLGSPMARPRAVMSS